jgi:hypothetical protein
MIEKSKLRRLLTKENYLKICSARNVYELSNINNTFYRVACHEYAVMFITLENFI